MALSTYPRTQYRPYPADPNALNFYLAQQQAAREDERYRQERESAKERYAILERLLQSKQAGHDRAFQANENRYLDILQMLGQTRNRVAGDLAQYGQGQLSDLDRTYKNRERQLDELRAQEQARAMSLGLGGTSRMGTINTAHTRRVGDLTYDRQAALDRVNDSIINRRVNTDIALTGGNIPSFMERKTDAYPDNIDLSQLAMQLGQIGSSAPLPPSPMYQYPQYQQFQQPQQPQAQGGRFQYRVVTPRGSAEQAPSPNDEMRLRNIAQQRQANDQRARNLMALYSDVTHEGVSGGTQRNQLENLLVDLGYAHKGPDILHYMQGTRTPGVNLGGGTPVQGSSDSGLQQVLMSLLNRGGGEPRYGGQRSPEHYEQIRQQKPGNRPPRRSTGDAMQRVRRIINSRGNTMRRGTSAPFQNYAYGIA